MYLHVYLLSENIRFEGYQRPDGSVTAHQRTQEKLLRDGTGEIEGSTRGPRGPKKQSLILF